MTDIYMFHINNKSKNRNWKSGYMALLGVLVVSAVAISITVSLVLLGLGSSRTTFAIQQGAQARALASACAEEALRTILDIPSFLGSGNLTLGRGTCTYSVADSGGGGRIIEAEGTVDNVVRKVRVSASSISPSIDLTSWQEVADF